MIVSNNLVALNETSFEAEVMGQSKPVLVMFMSRQYGSSQIMLERLERLSHTVGDSVKLCTLDVDENSRLANDHRIQTIPTTLIFRDGEVVDRLQFLVPESHLRVRLSHLVSEE